MAASSATSPRAPWTQAIPRLRAPRINRRRVIQILLVTAMLAGGWMWFRNSQLVAVNNVQIAGVRGLQAQAISSALQGAATEMTTLNVRPAALRAAVAEYPIVKSISATPSFPHKLRIDVVEHTVVAAVIVGGRQIPVAEDGTILRGAYVQDLTPLTARTPPVGQHLTDPFLLAAVHVLAAASPSTRHRVLKVFMGPRGLTLRFKDGTSAAFGSGHRAAAKWIALATMRATPSAASAKLIDVTVPERPAVPGLAPLPTTSTTATTPTTLQAGTPGATTIAPSTTNVTPSTTTVTPSTASATPVTSTQTPVQSSAVGGQAATGP